MHIPTLALTLTAIVGVIAAGTGFALLITGKLVGLTGLLTLIVLVAAITVGAFAYEALCNEQA